MGTRNISGPPVDGQPTEEFVEEWRNAAYNCFSSGHKFCREVCPVMQVTRNESWTPTAFHANVVAMEQGRARRSRTSPPTTSTARSAGRASCAARTRCSPATSTASAPAPSTSSRRSARSPSSSGIHQPGWQRWNERTDERTHEPVLGDAAGRARSTSRDWAAGLDLPIGGETVLFVDCEAAFYRTSVPRAVAQILQLAGVRVRADGRAVVLRRPGRRDGVRRAGAAVRPAQPRQLARHRHQARARARPARLHHASPRTTRSTSAPSSTSRSSWSSSCSPS